MTKYLVICHGNVNRSPLAEHIIKKAGFDISSAGFLRNGRVAAKKTRDMASEQYGYDLSEHKSRKITKEMVDEADVILYMDNGNYRRLEYLFPEAAQTKARCLGDFVGATRLPDPGFMPKDSVEFKAAIELVVEASLAFTRDAAK